MTDERQPAPQRSAPGGWFVAAPAIALVVGLVIGGLVVWAGQGGSSNEAAPSTTPSPTPSASATAPGNATVVVPRECLAAADTVQEATDVFRDLVSAFRDFRAEELRNLLDRLETLQKQARSEADACRDVEVTGTATPYPTAS